MTSNNDTIRAQRAKSSPCVRNCCLDDSDICLGCFRSLNEIINWSELDDAQYVQVLDNIEQRRAAKRHKE